MFDESLKKKKRIRYRFFFVIVQNRPRNVQWIFIGMKFDSFVLLLLSLLSNNSLRFYLPIFRIIAVYNQCKFRNLNLWLHDIDNKIFIK